MIMNNDMAKRNVAKYSNNSNKLNRDIRDGKLIQIVNGLYETDAKTSSYLLTTAS